MQERSDGRETEERDERIDRWLTDFFRLNHYHLGELQYLLDKSWQRYVTEHAFSLARDRAFGTGTPLTPGTDDLVESVRIMTSSEKKWSYIAPIIMAAGLKPVKPDTTPDEEHIHMQLRKYFDTWQDHYPLRVARMKQQHDDVTVPTLTLDTVTYVDGAPLEKPTSPEEARHLIRIASGGEVTTYTSWVLLMTAKSGSTIELLNTATITYSIAPLSATEIRDYVDGHPRALTVPVGLDLSDAADRERYIDFSQPVSFYGKNHLGHSGILHLDSSDLASPLFDPYFSGVPTHPIEALLPHVHDIYLHGDPLTTDIV